DGLAPNHGGRLCSDLCSSTANKSEPRHLPILPRRRVQVPAEPAPSRSASSSQAQADRSVDPAPTAASLAAKSGDGNAIGPTRAAARGDRLGAPGRVEDLGHRIPPARGPELPLALEHRQPGLERRLLAGPLGPHAQELVDVLVTGEGLLAELVGPVVAIGQGEV